MTHPQFLRFTDRDSCLQQLAACMVEQLQQVLVEQFEASLLLAGGSSPHELLPYLIKSELDWMRVRATPTDERWVPADAPKSNLAMLCTGLAKAQWLDPRQGQNPLAAAQVWGQQLRDWLPFSAVLLGMGEDGHIASLFPDMPGLAAALDITQPPVALLGQAPDAPQTRLSLNLSMLLNTRWLGLLVFGQRKAELLEQALADTPESRVWPVHALLHQQRMPANIYWAP